MNHSAARSVFFVVLVVCGTVAAGNRMLGTGPATASAEPIVEDDFTAWLDHIMERPLTAAELAPEPSPESATIADKPADPGVGIPDIDPYERGEALVAAPAHMTETAPVSRAVIVQSGASRIRQGFGQISTGMSHLEVALLLGPPGQSDSSDRWLYATTNTHSSSRDIYAIEFIDGEVMSVARLRFIASQPV